MNNFQRMIDVSFLSNFLFFFWYYSLYIFLGLFVIYFIFIRKPVRHQCADIIVVVQEDGTLKSSPFYVIFPEQCQDKEIEITINGELQDWKMHLEIAKRVPFFKEAISSTPKTKEKKHFHEWFTQTTNKLREKVETATLAHDIITPNSEQLEKLNQILQRYDYQEVNTIEFSDGELTSEGYLFCYNFKDKIVVSDIDGTITKSDIRGHLYTSMDKDYTHVGTAELFKKIENNGYKFIYLSARPVTMAKKTRRYISRINQNGFKMPVSPVITSPNKAMDSFIREVLIKEPHIFKVSILSAISNLFPSNPFVGGFGNRDTVTLIFTQLLGL